MRQTTVFMDSFLFIFSMFYFCFLENELICFFSSLFLLISTSFIVYYANQGIALFVSFELLFLCFVFITFFG